MRRQQAGWRKRQLAAAVQGAALAFVFASSLHAGDILRRGAPAISPSATDASSAAIRAAASRANERAKDALSRTTKALSNVRNAQNAARNLSVSGANNLGADPNRPGFQLPDVPDGLAPNGLEMHPDIATNPALWKGANYAAQSQASDGGVQVTVQQTEQTAVLNWRTFNVGRNTRLHFDQSAGGDAVNQWIAFNKITDPSGSPTQILGSITAQGQVYVINQNGIIFGGGSQVNTHTLVASSLPINDNLIDRGLLNNPDAQFLFSALPIAAGAQGTPAFTPPVALTPDGKTGDVTVQAGAQLSAPTTADRVGGRVMLVGPNVTNAGTISTPDGQTILAAGLQVGFDSHRDPVIQNDASLRGLDTYVGSIVDPVTGVIAGTATNSGVIEAQRGNVTMAGKTVNQLGVIASTTSVSLNGRIDLDASYDAQPNTNFTPLGQSPPFFVRSAGFVNIGDESATFVVPEYSSNDKVVGTSLALRSQINVRGNVVRVGRNAVVLATGGDISISAGVWNYFAGETQSVLAMTNGQIYIDEGAMINVAGSTDIAVALEQSILNVELRGAELADSPVQREGDLRAVELTVDLRKSGTYNGKEWVGTPLGDLSGYVGLIERSIGELTAAGGNVKLKAGSSVVINRGATVDVSGGYLNQAGGYVQTTRVMADGQILDISQATPDRIYDGIYTGKYTENHSRWGVSKTYKVPWMGGGHYEPSSIWGANGGTIEITAPNMVLDGEMRGEVIIGERQREKAPAASELSLNFSAQRKNVTSNVFATVTPSSPAITFNLKRRQQAADAFTLDANGMAPELRADRAAEVVLSPELLTEGGFGVLRIDNGNGSIEVPQGVELAARPGGEITFKAANVTVGGAITVPGGKINLTALNVSPSVLATLNDGTPSDMITPLAIPARGIVSITPTARVSAAGLIIDDRLTNPLALTMPLGVNVRSGEDFIVTDVSRGGTVSIAGQSVDVAPGSVIDVSGGVKISALSRRTYGNGGSISLKAGQDPGLKSVLGGRLTLGGTLLGYSGAKAGSLTLQSQIIQVGGTALHPDALVLQPEFFNQGGFGSFSLIGIGVNIGTAEQESYLPGIFIAPGVEIAPVVQSRIVELLPTARWREVTQPEGVRTPASLSFTALGAVDDYGQLLLKVRGDVVMSEGASITTDALGSVTMKGDTVSVLGSITAPSGTIKITGASKFPSLDTNPQFARTTVYLGPGSKLSTAGKTLYSPDAYGRAFGSVLPGGTISVGGNVVAMPGAVLDVSGTSGALDMHPSYLNLDATLTTLQGGRLVPLTSGLTSPLYSLLTVPVQVDSDGGAINLAGGEFLLTQATLKGDAGGPTALGGSLSITSGKFYPVAVPNSDKTPANVTLTVTQLTAFPIAGIGGAVPGIGTGMVDAQGNAVGHGWFAANDFLSGGFNNLTLGGTVQFQGPVAISARGKIKVASAGVIYADSPVTLTAPYVALGTAFTTPFSVLSADTEKNVFNFLTANGNPYKLPPTFGAGSLTVTASLIDIGNLSLQGIGSTSLIADNGDVRGNGTFEMAGDLYIRAGQVYPTTAGTFTLIARDYTNALGAQQRGSITFVKSGDRALPYSAGGELNVFASIINQGGVLRAPLGSITLGWDGTGDVPLGNVSGIAVPIAQQVTLQSGSITSVSAVDPLTGQGLVIPYGLVQNGEFWVDPAGDDITAGGVPQKTVTIAGVSVTTEAGSTIDISGGGDLYAYQWVKGNGGSTDVLASNGSFAVIPGYSADYSPYAAFNASSVFDGDPGYVNDSLSAGDRVYLSASGSLPAGVYTLLPARYALLPGAVLVTPKSGQPVGSFGMTDGSYLVNGYRYSSLDDTRDVQGIYQRFEVASGAVVRARSEYNEFSANSFLRERAIELDLKVPRLPQDAGHAILQATQSMIVMGDINARSKFGRAGLVDLNSPGDVLITGDGSGGGAGQLVLSSALLNSWGAESLLIGGRRKIGTDFTTITTRTRNITVSNAGVPLTGPEIILSATRVIDVQAGSSIIQSGALGAAADVLVLGDANVAGSGNGALLRVSGDFNALTMRNGVTVVAGPNLMIGAGATVSGVNVQLDSTFGMFIDPSATVTGRSISLSAGQVSLLFDNPGAQQANTGLVLQGSVLQGLQSAEALSILSYTSLDLYGTGRFSTLGTLALNAGEIRGFNNAGGTLTFAAPSITLGNRSNGTGAGPVAAKAGTLVFDATTVLLSSGHMNIDQYAAVNLIATGGMTFEGTGGLASQGSLSALTPSIAAGQGATTSITAVDALSILSNGSGATTSGGLGGSLTLRGASVNVTSDVLLPSGLVSMMATGGNVVIGGRVDVGGVARNFYDYTAYTSAGQITLSSTGGSVLVNAGSVLNLAAQSGGGNAGALIVEAPTGAFTLGGTVLGAGGAGGTGGAFSLDVGVLASLAPFDTVMNAASMTRARLYRVRTGDVAVNGAATASSYFVSADAGSILVTGNVNASGATGGTISLIASGSVTLGAGSVLNVSAQNFSSAGKGGAVFLEGGAQVNGLINTGALVNIQTGSTINLTVAAQTAASASFGQFTGTLHLRAPQNAASTDLQVAPINGTILGASAITVEGYKLFDLTNAAGAIITSTVQTNIRNNGIAFLGTGGTTTAGYTAMLNRLTAGNATITPLVILQAGAEVINRTGDLTLGTSNSTSTADWNLATNRFGAKSSAGVLTLRAAGNLVFFNALNDGFTTSAYNSLLLNQNTLLPANSQSYSYRLTSGADFTAADFREMRGLDQLATNKGSLLVGKNANENRITSGTTSGLTAQTSNAVGNRFQVIRTGSGSIDVNAGRDVQLLNQFSNIYTVGTKVLDATMGGTFRLPDTRLAGTQGSLGSPQQGTNQGYAAQYTMAGGNVSVTAQNDIARYTVNGQGQLIIDTTREMPTNWLYRRSYIDPATGQFGVSPGAGGEIASTTWWVDFSNFFQGVGALGGGNVTLNAGRNVINVDAVVPTNARMPSGTPNASALVELGGGDVTVRAGNNIDGGVYYVERGKGVLSAGGSITTNSARSISLTSLQQLQNILPQESWMPTTLFVGKSSFDVSARGDLLLGPVANTFLLPQGYSNTYWYKTYFSTYSATAGVNASSLGGSVTLRQGTSLEIDSLPSSTVPILELWYQEMLLLDTGATPSASNFQPWLRLAESSVGPFGDLFSLMPGTLNVTAFSGDINIAGNLTLSPSATGTINLLAAKAINGLTVNSSATINGQNTKIWASSTINLSDASPASIPGLTSALSYQTIVGSRTKGDLVQTQVGFLDDYISPLFNESGSTTGNFGVVQTKRALHGSTLLHANDTSPVHLYAGTGSISGLTLFSPKETRIVAGKDITDVGLYLQNVSDDDISVVAAGRDIVVFNAASPLRSRAISNGNALTATDVARSGDIQISGPGTLEILAGRNLDLGVGPPNADGTGTGVTSIGNARNPLLPFEGASIIAAAGIGSAYGLGDSRLDFNAFIDKYITGSGGARYLSELSAMLDVKDPLHGKLNATTFAALSAEQQEVLALSLFYIVLRDAGRDQATTGSYQAGIDAISTLFPSGQEWKGDITLTSRQIKTRQGGDINLLAPGGKLTVGLDVIGAQPLDQGVLTERGGSINIFTNGNVDVGTSRIFTLRGGDIMIWSTTGDIAAGSASKTVKSAPPTRVVIDAQSADVTADLAGLATGGGIGVLATVAGVAPGDVDLIAPLGTVDAGDAGIRSSGNLRIAANAVLNAGNIAVGGSSVGTPSAPAVSTPNVGGLTSAASSAGASTSSATQAAAAAAKAAAPPPPSQAEPLSIITVEVIGYGGGAAEEEDDEEKKRKAAQSPASTTSQPVQ